MVTGCNRSHPIPRRCHTRVPPVGQSTRSERARFLPPHEPVSPCNEPSEDAHMRWTPRGRSPNLEDRRGSRMGMPIGIGGGVILLILSLLFGRDFTQGTGTTTVESPGELAPADSAREEPMVQFVSFVLDDAQGTWRRIFEQAGRQYQDAK